MIHAMLASPLWLLAGVVLAAGSVAAAQSSNPTPSPKPPPPIRLPLAALVPEAVIDIAGATDFASVDAAIWTVSRALGEAARIDAKTNAVAAKLTIGRDLCAAAIADFGGLFIPRCAAMVIARIDAKTGAPGDPVAAPIQKDRLSMATGASSLWVIADGRGTVLRIDPVASAVVAFIHTDEGASGLAFGSDALWVANPEKNTVTRINPHNNLVVESIPVPGGPSAISASEGSVWTWNRADGSLSRLNPNDNNVAATVKLGAGAGDARIAAGGGSIWISRAGATLSRVDARTNVLSQVFTGESAGAIGLGHGSVWLAVSPTRVWRLDPARIEATRSATPPRALAVAPSPSPSPTP